MLAEEKNESSKTTFAETSSEREACGPCQAGVQERLDARVELPSSVQPPSFVKDEPMRTAYKIGARLSLPHLGVGSCTIRTRKWSLQLFSKNPS